MSSRRPFGILLAIALFIPIVPGCGGSTEVSVSEPPPQATDSAKTAKEKEDAMKNYDPRKNATGG